MINFRYFTLARQIQTILHYMCMYEWGFRIFCLILCFCIKIARNPIMNIKMCQIYKKKQKQKQKQKQNKTK